MSLYPVDFKIVRREDEPLTCAGCDQRLSVKQLAIRIERVVDQDVSHWHFACALLQEIVIEDTIVRLARQFRGKTR